MPQPTVLRRRVGLKRSALLQRKRLSSDNVQNPDETIPSLSAASQFVRSSSKSSDKHNIQSNLAPSTAKGFRSPMQKSFNSPLNGWFVTFSIHRYLITHSQFRTTKNFCFPDVDICSELSTSSSGPPTPQVIIPSYFSSLEEYRFVL